MIVRPYVAHHPHPPPNNGNVVAAPVNTTLTPLLSSSKNTSKIDPTPCYKRTFCGISLCDVRGYIITGLVLLPTIYVEAAEIRNGVDDMEGKKLLGLFDTSETWLVESIFYAFFLQNVWAFSTYTHFGLKKFYNDFLKETYKIFRDRNWDRLKTSLCSPALLLSSSLTIMKGVIDGFTTQYIATEILKVPYGAAIALSADTALYVVATDGIETYDWLAGKEPTQNHIAAKALGIPITMASVLGSCIFSSKVIAAKPSWGGFVFGVIGGGISSAAYTWRVTTDYLNSMMTRIPASWINSLASIPLTFTTAMLIHAYYEFNKYSFGKPSENVPFDFPGLFEIQLAACVGFSANLAATTIGSMLPERAWELSTCCRRPAKEANQLTQSDPDSSSLVISVNSEGGSSSTPTSSESERIPDVESPIDSPSEDTADTPEEKHEEQHSERTESGPFPNPYRSISGYPQMPLSPKTNGNGKHVITACRASHFIKKDKPLRPVTGETEPLLNTKKKWGICLIM